MLKGARLLTVSELTDEISRALQGNPRLTDVTVAGELSNFVRHSSGHMYFTLKDKNSSIKGVMFSTWNRLLPFTPADGLQVYLRGDVAVYKKGGNYQLNAYLMEPVGQGALALAFAQLKEKLAKEGLFAPERKRPLPRFPRRIGLVTSPQAAALQDFLRTAAQQGWPATFLLAPAIVQGAKGAASVVAALERLYSSGAEVIVVTRGGGSSEELWVFNEEAVARAAAASPVPLVSAVGHETDFTILDYVADARAATPTAAARLVLPEAGALLAGLARQQRRLEKAAFNLTASRRRRLENLASRPVLARPLQLLLSPRQSLDLGDHRLRHAFTRLFAQGQSRLKGAAARLADLNPLSVLARGYAIVGGEKGIVKSINQLRPGDQVSIRVRDGRARAGILAVGGDEDGTEI